MPEPWCEILGIQPPRLESVVGHREANTFALLIVSLLERAAPMTLAEAAERMAQAGAGDRQTLLASLSRCRAARPPIYRDGDRYTLDPYDQDGALWVYRLGLREPLTPAAPRPVEPTAPPEVPLSARELDEAWTDECVRRARPTTSRPGRLILAFGPGPMEAPWSTPRTAASPPWLILAFGPDPTGAPPQAQGQTKGAPLKHGNATSNA